MGDGVEGFAARTQGLGRWCPGFLGWSSVGEVVERYAGCWPGLNLACLLSPALGCAPDRACRFHSGFSQVLPGTVSRSVGALKALRGGMVSERLEDGILVCCKCVLWFD